MVPSPSLVVNAAYRLGASRRNADRGEQARMTGSEAVQDRGTAAPAPAPKVVGGSRNRRVVALVMALLLVAVGGVLALLAASEAPPVEFEPVQGRLGLHVTQAELAMWRERANFGPYRRPGDAGENTPGDWQRITERAAAFVADPSAGRWTGPIKNNPGGCVLRSSGQASDPGFVPPFKEASELRDAAFVAMVTGRDQYARLAKAELLAQVAEPNLDLGDRGRWCLEGIEGDNNPIFLMANWLSRLLFAYDYLRIADARLFTDAEQRTLDEWFRGGAEWMQPAVNRKLDALFVDRDGGDYALTEVGEDSYTRPLYFDGPKIRTLARRYNNRAAAAARYVALVGVDQRQEGLIHSSKTFVRDALTYTYYPQGVIGEFERWRQHEPTLGWKYALEFTGSLVTIADVLARVGDESLYEYQTTEGALGTEGEHHLGGPRSLETLAEDLARYVDGTYERYATREAGQVGDPEYLISSIDGRSGRAFIHDGFLLVGNRYWDNAYVESVVTRQSAGAPPLPVEPARSQGDPTGGEWGIYPGVRFMFLETP